MEKIFENLKVFFDQSIFETYSHTLDLSTTTYNDGSFDINIIEDYIISNYVYIHDVDIQKHGIKTDNYDITDTIHPVYIDVSIYNNIKHLISTINFEGSYDKELYYDVKLMDHAYFVAEVKIKGITKSNEIFAKNENPLGELLECMDALSSRKIGFAFLSAYTGLEMLIKQTNNLSRINPIETRDHLKQLGFDYNRLEQIRLLRNNHEIHPNKFGYVHNYPNLFQELEESLEYIIYVFSNLFEKDKL